MSGYEAIVAAAIAAVASIGTTVYSSHQQEKSEERQRDYQQAILDEETAAEEKEKELARQARERSKAYGMSLLNSDTTLNNALTSSGFSNDLDNSYSLLGSTYEEQIDGSKFFT